MPHGLRTRQQGEALPALVLQDLPAAALLTETLGDTLAQPFQPLLLAPILCLQGFDDVFAGLDHGLAFALKLSPARFHALRLLSLGEQLSMPGSRRLLLGLGRLSGRQTLRDASLGAIEPPLFALDPPRLLVQRGLFLPDRREARLEETRRLGRFLAERPDLVLPEQIGQQGLDLGIAVGAQLPLALRRKRNRPSNPAPPAEPATSEIDDVPEQPE